MVTPSHHSRDTTTTQPRRSHEAAKTQPRRSPVSSTQDRRHASSTRS
ncbi:MAG: hypothetical protein AB8B36_11710 [Prochlorococcus sp.]